MKWEGEAVSQTIDTGTPIFGALYEEFELPEITVHDFDEHAFDFLRADDAKDTSNAPEELAEASEGGGRRRKND